MSYHDVRRELSTGGKVQRIGAQFENALQAGGGGALRCGVFHGASCDLGSIGNQIDAANFCGKGTSLRPLGRYWLELWCAWLWCQVS